MGTAWSSSNDNAIKQIHVAVGIGFAGGLRDIASLHQKTEQLEIENSLIKLENQKLKKEYDQILSRIKSIENALKLK